MIKEFPLVIFSDSDHTYWYGQGPHGSDLRRKLDSVTTIWAEYCQPFKTDIVLGLCALAEIQGSGVWPTYFKVQNYVETEDDLATYFPEVGSELYLDTKATVEFWWEMGNQYGTQLHNTLEAKAYEEGKVYNPADEKFYPVVNTSKQFDNQSVVANLSDLQDGAYPELLVWNAMWDVAGQVDLCIVRTHGGKRYVDLIDYKTNGGYSEEEGLKKREEIKKLRKTKKMLPPVDHLWDCTRSKYRGQLSMYAWILEQEGFHIRNLAVTHFLNYNPNQGCVIPMGYQPKECKAILEHRANTKPLNI